MHRIGWLVLHPTWGLAFFILVNWIVKAEARWREMGNVPDMVSRLALIGVFSYSLYLTHQLVIMASWRFVIGSWPPLINTLLVITPLSIGCAWLFYWFCERPYMKPSAPAKTQFASGNITAAQDTASA